MNQPAAEDALRFQRANFVVTDLERALALYRDVLGMRLEFVKDSPPDSYSYTVFEIPPDTPLRFAVLGTPAQPRVMALTEVRDASLPAAPTPRRSAIVLDVADVDGVIAGASAAGLKVYPEESLETHDGRRGREAGIVDSDGNLVVVYRIDGRRPAGR